MSLKALVLLLIVTVTEVTSMLQQQLNVEWDMFKVKYNKTYLSKPDEQYRYSVFTENVRQIQFHNIAADKGHYSFWMKINHIADWTDEEYEEKLTGLNMEVDLRKKMSGDERTQHIYNVTLLPKQIDWRNKKCVTPVKYQGDCSSCYAFAATGALESQHCLKTGNLVTLSEQNIVDCTYNNMYRNKGCRGGLMDNAYQYVIDNGGIDTEQSYPYKDEVGTCKYKKKTIGATARGYQDIRPSGDEYELKRAVGGLGPVSVGVDARGTEFKLYDKGVYDNVLCSSTRLTHSLLVVGYGTTDDGQDYWLLKNSWGIFWGMEGYMMMTRNKGNRCGIATVASYPIV